MKTTKKKKTKAPEPWLAEASRKYELLPKKPFPESWSPRAVKAVEGLMQLRNSDRKKYTFRAIATGLRREMVTVQRWFSMTNEPENYSLDGIEKYLEEKGITAPA